jgi:hypothetical protein
MQFSILSLNVVDGKSILRRRFLWQENGAQPGNRSKTIIGAFLWTPLSEMRHYAEAYSGSLSGRARFS